MTMCTVVKAWLYLATLGLLLVSATAAADDRGQTTSAPGFRPDNANATAFLDSLDSATVAVLPSIVRRQERTAHSFSSQRLAVSMLNDRGLIRATLANKRIDLGNLQRISQWNLFQYGLDTVARKLAGYSKEADYFMVLEFLVPDNQSVFGIECYIVDREGRDVFSFLLNSHHEMFMDAKLRAGDSSEEAREAMLKAATEVAISALSRQIKEARTHGQDKTASADPESAAPASDATRMRLVIITRLHQRLKDVFMHSFKHSLVSGFESNGIAARVLFMARDSEDTGQFQKSIEAFAADAVMTIDIDPLLRKRKDDYEAIVGTDFDATLVDRESGEITWQMSDKVDYIRMFDRRYTAHTGIRKEFAWSTTEAIVSRLMEDLYDTTSARIYTVTEDRQRHGQRID